MEEIAQEEPVARTGSAGSLLFGPVRPYPTDEGLYEIFARTAARTPDKIAIIAGKCRLTYATLAQRVTELAAQLHALGVGEGTAVGLYFGRSLEHVVATFAILHAGGTYVPLDPAQPVERLEGMVEDSGLALVLGGAAAAAVTWPEGVRVVNPEKLRAPRGVAEFSRPADRGGARACILFTSGSTGRPKGAQLTHRGLNALVINSDAFDFTPDDVVAHVANVAFDASSVEIFGALLNGGRLFIVPPVDALEPLELFGSLRQNGVTVLILTAALFHQFARFVPSAFGFLRLLISAGDALSPSAARAVLESDSPPGALQNGYGPAECTVCCTASFIRSVPTDATSLPIGRPVANNNVYLLDADRRPVALCEKGEIYAGGPKISLGYAGRPELTAAAFFPDPFAGTPGARMYKTGDLARLGPDGELEFLGRIDEQVKIRGFRVEPAEIEAALLAHPCVGQSKVRLWHRADAGKMLIGYISARNGARPQPEELRTFLGARLPEYSIPGAFIVVDAWPLTPNGKIDTGALPLPSTSQAEPHAAAHTAVQEVLVELWTGVLGTAPASLEQDFFLAGGHSLLAIQLISRIRERFGVNVPVRQLFETPTLQGLATYIEKHRPAPESFEGEFLMPMQKGNPERQPLFVVPGGTGRAPELLALVRLLRAIGTDQPAYGFKVRERDGRPDPQENAEAVATAYVRELRQAQPHGPYAILGECIGGVIAYEMARQLEAAGEKISLLMVLDSSWPDAAVRRWFLWQRLIWERWNYWLGRWDARIRQPLRGHRAKLAPLRWREKMRYFWERRTRLGQLSPTAPTVKFTREPDEYLRSIMAAQPKTWGGKVTLLVATTYHLEHGDLGWSSHPGKLEVHILEGDHNTCIREHAALSGAKLRELLEASAPQTACA